MIEEGGNRKESGSERSMEHNSGDKSYFFTFSKQIMYISIMMMMIHSIYIAPYFCLKKFKGAGSSKYVTVYTSAEIDKSWGMI